MWRFTAAVYQFYRVCPVGLINYIEGQITCVARKTGIILAASIRVCECVCVSISLFACLLKTENKLSETDITVVMCCVPLK